MFTKLFLSALLTFFVDINVLAQQNTEEEYTISGQFLLDTIWARVAYLSYIPSFNEMYTMTSDMIIEDKEIDNSGNFTFNTSYLPSADNLYRIHISKIGDPPTSLIIGGNEENHLFIIANRTSNVYIKNKAKETLFKEISISGYHPNQTLQRIDEIFSYIDSSQFNASPLKREFVTKAIYEKLRYVADTSMHPLVSLYSLYKSKFELNLSINQQYYKNYLKKWGHEKSSYFTSFKSQLPFTQDKERLFRLLIGFVAFIIGLIINYLFNRFAKRKENQIKSLSVQERKIFNFIQLGKSNKEISDECNIGLSTVKSHASNIYSKLNIKSRKEAMDIKL